MAQGAACRNRHAISAHCESASLVHSRYQTVVGYKSTAMDSWVAVIPATLSGWQGKPTTPSGCPSHQAAQEGPAAHTGVRVVALPRTHPTATQKTRRTWGAAGRVPRPPALADREAVGFGLMRARATCRQGRASPQAAATHSMDLGLRVVAAEDPSALTACRSMVPGRSPPMGGAELAQAGTEAGVVASHSGPP